jgi:aspartate/methionine/tyrosine aminotransferase
MRRTAAVERDGLEIRAFTLINPGNPTGQVMSREELEIICKFCSKYDIVLLADEVYQVCCIQHRYYSYFELLTRVCCLDVPEKYL